MIIAPSTLEVPVSHPLIVGGIVLAALAVILGALWLLVAVRTAKPTTPRRYTPDGYRTQAPPLAQHRAAPTTRIRRGGGAR
jgi:hypothetical protein